MTRILLILGAVLTFGAVNWQVIAKEHLRSTGQVVYLSMAPRDPRSVMQGDYMALNFALARELATPEALQESGPRVGILKLNGQRVGEFSRLENGGPLNSGEARFRFRIRQGGVWLGTNAFFFQEGDDRRYSQARYGEFRVSEDGDAMLVGLRDKDLQALR